MLAKFFDTGHRIDVYVSDSSSELGKSHFQLIRSPLFYLHSRKLIMNIEVTQGSLPVRKRKSPEEEDIELKLLKRPTPSKAREIRLEQNRKAARESRRRKKSMVEELQRSVIFFSRANNTLKHQNDELTRLLMQAQAQVAALENQSQTLGQTMKEDQVQPMDSHMNTESQEKNSMEQAHAQTVATQAMYESQGFPSAAARAAAQSINATTSTVQTPTSAPADASLPQMQPGATMQAMAEFQQAASAAMQAAVQGMQGNPTLTPTTPSGPNPQQVFNNTMTAIAMQQAAAAAVTGQHFLQSNPFMAPMLAWQNHQAALATGSQQGENQGEAAGNSS